MPIDIDRVKELLAKATPGNWAIHQNEALKGRLSVGVAYANSGGDPGKAGHDYVRNVCAIGHPMSGGEFDGDREDAAFIAAAPDIARLAIELSEEVERLRGKYEKP